jgi:hypothetical protein
MKNAPSGGDGKPSSPERAKVVESTATEDTVSLFSEENPSGLEELQMSGTATNTARRARNPENTSPGLVNKLPTVPETTEGEDKEDLEESKPGIADKRDGVGDDMLLASGGETTAFSSFTMSQETTVPPCHQTMETSDMEISLDDDEDDETKTIIASEASSQNMQFIK